MATAPKFRIDVDIHNSRLLLVSCGLCAVKQGAARASPVAPASISNRADGKLFRLIVIRFFFLLFKSTHE